MISADEGGIGMDLIKIGLYIAGKRKALGLTQRQVAEALGMSDKSVSKWERGVCLPDVSVFADLCRVLGITLNEFLAGEDLGEENVVRKSEENIIGMAADGKRKQRRLKRVICLLLAVSVPAIAIFCVAAIRAERPQNYIVPVSRDSVEMKTVELLTGADGAFLYEFTASEEYTALDIFFSEFRSGELVKKESCGLSYEDMASPRSGTILIVPDLDTSTVRLIVADEYAKFSTSIPILEDAENRQLCGRTATQLGEKTGIAYDGEQGLVALIYDSGEMQTVDLQALADGNAQVFSKNDYMYYFSVRFGTD